MTVIFCLTATACGTRKYYLPGGGRNASGGGCGCPSFSTLTPPKGTASDGQTTYSGLAAAPAGTPTSANA